MTALVLTCKQKEGNVLKKVNKMCKLPTRSKTESVTVDVLNNCLLEMLEERSMCCKQITLDNYKYKTNLFLNFAEEVNTRSGQFELQDCINKYVAHLNNKYASKTSVYSNLRVLKVFFNWMYENNYIERPVKLSIKSIPTSKTPYTISELSVLLRKEKWNNYTEYRNWVIVNFLIGTGCRINTLVNMKVKDVDMENEVLYFTHTKNGIEQIVPLSITLKKVLKEWVKVLEEVLQVNSNCGNIKFEDVPLFPNVYGNKLNANSVTHAIASYNKKRGINKTSCHLFRHTFAYNYIANGGNVFKLQKLLGHSTLEMTKRYTNVDVEMLKSDWEEVNVLDELERKNKRERIKLR